MHNAHGYPIVISALRTTLLEVSVLFEDSVGLVCVAVLTLLNLDGFGNAHLWQCELRLKFT